MNDDASGSSSKYSNKSPKWIYSTTREIQHPGRMLEHRDMGGNGDQTSKQYRSHRFPGAGMRGEESSKQEKEFAF